MSYQPKTYRKQGGDEFVVASGGKITVESGGLLNIGATDFAAILAAIPTTDPVSAGVIWNNAGVLTASAGA